MAKTRELSIKCDEASVKSEGYRLKVVLEEPDIDGLLSELDEEYLKKWAEENGYIKA